MPGVVLIVSIPDICLLPYFLYSHEYRLTRNTAYCAILSDHIVVGCRIRCAYFILIILPFRYPCFYLGLPCLPKYLFKGLIIILPFIYIIYFKKAKGIMLTV